MDILTLSLIFIALSLILVIMGVPIAYALGFCALFGILIGSGEVSLTKLGLTAFSNFHGLNWLPLPMFILMAYIISETDIGRDIFNTANNWLSRIPGGLVVGSIFDYDVGIRIISAIGTFVSKFNIIDFT